MERYIETKVGVRPSTKMNYNYVRKLLQEEEFAQKKISEIITSDAKLFLIKLQKEDGRGWSAKKL